MSSIFCDDQETEFQRQAILQLCTSEGSYSMYCVQFCTPIHLTLE